MGAHVARLVGRGSLQSRHTREPWSGLAQIMGITIYNARISMMPGPCGGWGGGRGGGLSCGATQREAVPAAGPAPALLGSRSSTHLVAQRAIVPGAGISWAGGQLLRCQRRKGLAGGLRGGQALQGALALVQGCSLRELVCRAEVGAGQLAG